MSDALIQLLVNQDTPRSETEGNQAYWKGNKRGEACVIDFYTEMALEGRGFQIRAGTVTTPLVGDVVLTDAVAELAVQVPQGLAILVVYFNVAVRLGTGTLHEYALKSVDGTATTSTGTFTPLSLLMDTNARGSGCAAAVSAAGGVVVVGEAATTTRRLWAASNPVAVGAGHSQTTHVYEPRTPHTIANVAHAYAQIAATGTGPSYYASLEYLEIAWVNIN